MSKLENVEGKFFIDFPTLKKHESGMLEIIINNYTVQLENQAQGNSIILLCDNKDLNIPNKFDKDDRNEALLFYKHIIDAVLEKAKLHISEYSDSNVGVQPDTFAMRFSSL